MPTKTEAIKLFLQHDTHPDLAALYDINMECQVNVAQDGGEPVSGEYKGRRWRGWSDGMTTWKPFRIPWNANSEPDYIDSEIKFDLTKHVEGIGMTGWDWQKKVSRWVAFDFDAILGHSKKHQSKLSNDQLEEIKNAACDVPWVTVRKSSGGRGLHLYVFLDPVVPTQNHNEHAALARAILGKLAAITGYDFESKVDICGGNMWVWHRKIKGTDGLSLIKAGETLDDPPSNWKDHLNVIKNKSKRSAPGFIQHEEYEDAFEELISQCNKVPLDDDHKLLLNYLDEMKAMWWFDQDRHMLVCHTADLKAAHDGLNLRGTFETLSEGKEHGADQNCFAFPLRKGAWALRRHTPGVQEDRTWEQDGQGWTRCYYNKEPDLKTACRANGGLENEKGDFIFTEGELAQKAAQQLGADLKLPARYLKGREVILKAHKDGRLIVQLKREAHDTNSDLEGWLPKKDQWLRIHNIKITDPTEVDVGNYDDLIRHVISETKDDQGWLLQTETGWVTEPLHHLRPALEAMGRNTNEIKMIIGSQVLRCWTLVNRPFEPEYLGNRQWNRDAAQLRFPVKQETDDLYYPTWEKLLTHVGQGLDDAIREDGWCKANGITNGKEYLLCWTASLFQEPLEPLPYLFLYGPQNSGKSIYHEALSLLVTKGYQRADNALISQSGFNGELKNSVICVVEETDLNRNKTANNRIKDWVTSRQLSIHEKGMTPYLIPNATHWVQCANDHNAVPVFPGDTRITMVFVPPIDPIDLIPKKQLIPMLEKEASDFLGALFNLELPVSHDRLNVPVIETEQKLITESQNQTDLERFISEKCYPVMGESIKFSEFYDLFVEWLDPNDVHVWSKQKVSKELPPQYPKGSATFDNNQVHIGNISFKDIPATQGKITLGSGNKLRRV